MLLDATVTLPGGGAAVVHAATIGSGGLVVGDQEGAQLTAVVLENFTAAAADPDECCPGIRHASPTVATALEDDLVMWFSANVLCAEERCRAEAEAYQAQLDEEHPAAPRLRAWALQLEGAQP